MMEQMVGAIKQLVTVREGGVVEVRSPELKASSQAEVIVLVQEESDRSGLSPLAALDALQKNLRLTPEKAGEWIGREQSERQTCGC